MHAADQRILPRRYAAPAVAIVAAAAVAVAPVATSMGAVAAPSLPPIVQDLGGAASAVANWATAMGLKFVTDPVTGLTKLVTDQVGNATVIGDVLLSGGQDLIEGVTEGLPKALAQAQQLIAEGKPGDAWQAIAFSLTGPILGQLLNGMTPIMNQLGPQIGPFADALTAAMPSIVGLVFPLLTSTITPPKDVLTGIAAATQALQAGDPFGAVNALLDTAAKVGEFAVEAMFGDLSITKGLAGLLPAVLSGLAGSSWADAGPFTLPTGNTVTFAPASASTLAASPTALPDFGAIGTIWTDSFKGVFDYLSGPAGLRSAIDAVLSGLPQGQFASPYVVAHGVLLAPLLMLGEPVIKTGDIINPYLGPIGNGIGGATFPLIMTTLGIYSATRLAPEAALTSIENVGKALAAGDPIAALQAVITGAGTTLAELNKGLFMSDPNGYPALLPSLVSIAEGFTDGVLGKTEPLDAGLMRTTAATDVDAAGADEAVGGDTAAGASGGDAAGEDAATGGGAPSEAGTPVGETEAPAEGAGTPAEGAAAPDDEAPAEEAPAEEVAEAPAASEEVTGTDEATDADTAGTGTDAAGTTGDTDTAGKDTADTADTADSEETAAAA
ncbi:hypothetical protein [Tsukamurella sp. PLM1]|uniref:hypothetical protein n=1 Tax=Tsukamurella sp. PLM1 TaxID=2929795 RepID=UPI00204E1AF0|nr:hypothetical protein [Tsukamurella sp. PLM1]BDH55903.1 hypothetical protein MTP03_08420 [Tsukamurella sp. PLM1]